MEIRIFINRCIDDGCGGRVTAREPLHASLWVTFTVTTCEEVSMALVVLTYGGVLLSASSAVARRVGLSFALS